jgi:PAS domain-containing protein
MGAVTQDPELAAWLVMRRGEIERALAARLGEGAPQAAAPETEALRRFRSFAAFSLERGRPPAPSLDGIHADEARVGRLLGAWSEAAAEVAGERGEAVRRALAPLVTGFRAALRTTQPSRRASGSPRANRRAVVAAIDRVSDLFLAVDTANGRIVDANPAAGALLRLTRDALLEADVLRFVPQAERGSWSTELEAISEGAEPRRFRTSLLDPAGTEVPVDAGVTRYATRERTLALFVLRVER